MDNNLNYGEQTAKVNQKSYQLTNDSQYLFFPYRRNKLKKYE